MHATIVREAFAGHVAACHHDWCEVPVPRARCRTLSNQVLWVDQRQRPHVGQLPGALVGRVILHGLLLVHLLLSSQVPVAGECLPLTGLFARVAVRLVHLHCFPATGRVLTPRRLHLVQQFPFRLSYPSVPRPRRAGTGS